MAEHIFNLNFNLEMLREGLPFFHSYCTVSSRMNYSPGGLVYFEIFSDMGNAEMPLSIAAENRLEPQSDCPLSVRSRTNNTVNIC